MNFLSRLGHGIVIMFPTAVAATILIYVAWNWTCNSTSCKTINGLVMLTGFVLAGWSLIILLARLATKDHELKMSTGKSLVVNLTEILPLVLFYAAFTGAMVYFCFILFRDHLSGIEKKGNKLLFICGLFLPVYELTRTFERKKSVTGFGAQLVLHIQTLLTFAGWYYLMLFILKNRNALPSFEKAAKWQYLYLVGAMAAASFILYKCYEWIEKFLRDQGIISWNSKYFGKD